MHGAVLLDDGSVVFNFECHGLLRMGYCGDVLWRLPYMTHHSVFLAEDGSLWVPGRRYREAPSGAFPNLEAPFFEDTVLQLSQEGEILREISLLELFYANRMEGLLFANGRPVPVIDEPDVTHLNNVKVLSSELAGAFPLFEAGDVLVSLREINLLMVFDPKTRKIKWHQTGPWLRQHDPDFMPDGRISVFDNRRDGSLHGSVFGGSRILVVDPGRGAIQVAYAGTPEAPFFTDILGKHQRLPNGNILIAESAAGRAFEIDGSGRIVWSYINRFDEERVAFIEQADRLPEGLVQRFDTSCE